MPMTFSAPKSTTGPLSAAMSRQAESEFKKYGKDDDLIDAFELKKLLNKTFAKRKLFNMESYYIFFKG